jgi:hypothetical protein
MVGIFIRTTGVRLHAEDARNMFKSFVLALALGMLSSISLAQSIAGIHIGDPSSVLDKLNLKPTARDRIGSMDTVKYKLDNGNELSVTHESPAGRIVYLECDWNRNAESVATDFPGFNLGSRLWRKYE